MTEEQIADLRETAASAARGFGMAGVDRYCAVIGHEELTRLLDERERLLAALKDADCNPRCATFDRPRKPCDCGADAAISFAVGPLDIDPVHQM